MKKKSVKKEDKNIKLLSKDQEVLIKGPSHCELCKVIDVNKNSALLSNGISVNPKYDRKIKSLTPLNLKGTQFTILVHGSESKRIWKEYCLGNTASKLQSALENFKKGIIFYRESYSTEELDGYSMKLNELLESLQKETINE